jgi:hypothetical protein
MRIFLFAAVFVVFSACKPAPATLNMPEEQLVNVLADVHIAEAAIQNLRGETKDSTANLYYDQIYTIHGVTETQFLEAIDILQENPILMDQVYAQVLEKLAVTEANANNAKVMD